MASGSPADGEVTIDVSMETAGDFVSRVEHDILFDRSVMRLGGPSSCVINPAISEARPECSGPRPSLSSPCKTFTRELATCAGDPLPDGCPAGAPQLDRLRARIASVTVGTETALPGTTVLYSCTFDIVDPAQLPAVLNGSRAIAVSRRGVVAPTSSSDGNVYAPGLQTPASTWTPSPTPTFTTTRTATRTTLSTRTPTTAVPSPPSATPVQSPQATSTPTASPAGGGAAIRVAATRADARGGASVDVVLDTGGEEIGSVRHDLVFDARAVRLESAAACEIHPALSDALPRCDTAGPLSDPCKRFVADLASCATRPTPPGCASRDENAMRLRVVIDDGSRGSSPPIPDGTVLYQCQFDVVDVRRLPAPIISSEAILTTTRGRGVDAQAIDGAITGDAEPPPSTLGSSDDDGCALSSESRRSPDSWWLCAGLVLGVLLKRRGRSAQREA